MGISFFLICLGIWGSRFGDLLRDLGICFFSRFVWGFWDLEICCAICLGIWGDLFFFAIRLGIWGFFFSFEICLGIGDLGIRLLFFFRDLFGDFCFALRFVWDLGICFFRDLFGDLGIVFFSVICLGFGDLFLFRDSFGDFGICVFFT